MHVHCLAKHVQVAIKQLSLGPGTSELERSLFVKELIDTIHTSWQCDAVVQCYGYSILHSGQLCLVMRHYERGTLHNLLDDLQRECIGLCCWLWTCLSVSNSVTQFGSCSVHNLLDDLQR